MYRLHSCAFALFAIFGFGFSSLVYGQREFSVCKKGITRDLDHVCRKISDCPAAVEGLKTGIFPKICGYVGNIPVVCCAPNITAPTKPQIQLPIWGVPSDETTTSKPTTKTTRTPDAPVWGPTQAQPTPVTIGSGKRPTRNPVTVVDEMCQKYKATQYKTVQTGGLLIGQKPTIIKEPDCADHETLIIGGVKAKPKQFPHMAMIGFGTNYKYVHWACSGSLISERYVLTAAHCISSARGATNAPKWIRLGDLDYSVDTEDAKPQDFGIEDYIIHPNYKYPSVYDDIALLKLNRDAVFTAYVRPICLNTKYVLSDTNVTATGWGVLGPGTVESEHLMAVSLPLVSTAACNQSFGVDKKYAHGIDPNKMLCAGAIRGKDTCEGDSGGPLQHTMKDEPCMLMQVGITSFGSYLCGESQPGVYTRISNYISWIQSIVWPQ